MIINNESYYVEAINRTDSKLTLYPWIDNELTEGEITYVFGGSLVLRGNDSNVHRFSLIDAIRCGQGLAAGSLYMPTGQRLVAQFCGVGLSIGRRPGGAVLGGEIAGLYVENNEADILQISRQGLNQNNYCKISSEYALDRRKLKNCSYARTNSNIRDINGNAFARTILSQGGRNFQHVKPPQNYINAQSFFVLAINRTDQRITWFETGNKIVRLQIDPEINRLFGIDSVEIVITGSGAAGEPTGTITFETLQAGASVVTNPAGGSFSGLTKPLRVMVRYDAITSTFNVIQL